MALTENQKKANKLKIPWDENTSEGKLVELIEAEQAKIELEKQEAIAKQEAEDLAARGSNAAQVILKNTRGEEVDQKDYFYPGVDKDGKTTYAKPWFNKQCGMPVDDPELISIFDVMFKPSDNFLLYKVKGKEIYIVIVPLKLATTIGHAEDSLPGDFQKHSMSFIMEGSVNNDTFKLKLKKIRNYIRRGE